MRGGEDRRERVCDDIALRVRGREPERTTPLLKGLTWKRSLHTLANSCRVMHPNTIKITHGPARTSVWYTDTHKHCTSKHAHSCAKNKDKSMFDAPNPGSEERREWEDRKRASKRREIGRGGVGWLSESWRVVTQFSLLSICHERTGQECTGREGEIWGSSSGTGTGAGTGE